MHGDSIAKGVSCTIASVFKRKESSEHYEMPCKTPPKIRKGRKSFKDETVDVTVLDHLAFVLILGDWLSREHEVVRYAIFLSHRGDERRERRLRNGEKSGWSRYQVR